MAAKNSNMAQPEKLSWWDRWFNRYRKTPVDKGSEKWAMYSRTTGEERPNSGYQREWVMYLVVDRVTGSETLEKEYL